MSRSPIFNFALIRYSPWRQMMVRVMVCICPTWPLFAYLAIESTYFTYIVLVSHFSSNRRFLQSIFLLLLELQQFQKCSIYVFTHSSDTTTTKKTPVRILQCFRDLPESIQQTDMLPLTGLMVNNRQWFCTLLASCAQVGSEVQGFDNQGKALKCARSDCITFCLTCKSQILCCWKFHKPSFWYSRNISPIYP